MQETRFDEAAAFEQAKSDLLRITLDVPKTACVTGAGGFIGHHLVSYLKTRGYRVVGIDIKHPEFEPTRADEFFIADLSVEYQADDVFRAVGPVNELYMLAADMGGMGYISENHSHILMHNSLVNIFTLKYAVADRIFYSSSACVYPENMQMDASRRNMLETYAWRGAPDTAYGVEKLMTEELCMYFSDDVGVPVRIARFHNVYGPLGTWRGGREKAPAAMCRKIAMCELGINEEIEVWGNGRQVRSFLYIDDCIEGIYALMHSGLSAPINIGSEVAVSINVLVNIVQDIAMSDFPVVHIDGPLGVQYRNSDNTLCRNKVGWSPATSLRQGLELTYPWVKAKVREYFNV